MTNAIYETSVVDAVTAQIQQGRSYSEHWNYYMNAEQRSTFGDNCARFIDTCKTRRQYLEG